MPRIFTVGTLVTRCKQRCDQENSSHISDGEWQSLLGEAYGDLYSVVAGTGLRYFESSTTITTDGSASYDEPSAMLATTRVVRVNTDGTSYELNEAMNQEEPYFGSLTGDARFYSTVDDQLFLYPTPPTGQTYVWSYIAQPPDLGTSDTDDLVDVVTPDGEAFIIWATAVKALAKSESDPQLAMSEREASRARLAEWAQLRSFSQPRRRIVKDEYDYNDWLIDPASWWNRR